MRTTFGLLIIGILLLLAACGGAPTVQTEPTAAPIELPTAEPSMATSEPTPKPTKAPLPVISPDTVIGMFNQFDQQANGNNWLLFNADGTFTGRHGPSFDDGILVTEGTYRLEGDVLTLIDPEQCPAGESYRLEYRNQTQVHFELVGETACDYLAADFDRQPNWKRVDP